MLWKHSLNTTLKARDGAWLKCTTHSVSCTLSLSYLPSDSQGRVRFNWNFQLSDDTFISSLFDPSRFVLKKNSQADWLLYLLTYRRWKLLMYERIWSRGLRFRDCRKPIGSFQEHEIILSALSVRNAPSSIVKLLILRFLSTWHSLGSFYGCVYLAGKSESTIITVPTGPAFYQHTVP